MSNQEYAQATDEQLMEWAVAEFEAQADAREMEQLRWAEAGGYRSGLDRPGR